MLYRKNLGFIYQSPTKIIFREDSTKDLKIETEILGVNRVLIITDEGLLNSEIVAKVKDIFGERCVGIFGSVIPDTSCEIIEDGARFAKELKCNCLVSVGGGSSIDTAKAIAIIFKKGGKIRDYAGLPGIAQKLIPHIAVPTTAGTGSEVTMFAVIKDRDRNIKLGIADRNIIPDIAILDPLNTITLSPYQTAATGMDALSHAIEAIHSRNSSPITDALSLYAIKLIFEYLPNCVEDGNDLFARGMQLIASTIAGLSFSNAMVGIVHSLAHALGGKFNVPHGVACGIFLPHGMRFNIEKSAKKYALIAETLGIGNGDEVKKAEALINSVFEFTNRIGLPQKLSDVGVKEEDLNTIANDTLIDGNIITNPRRVFDVKDILNILKEAL